MHRDVCLKLYFKKMHRPIPVSRMMFLFSRDSFPILSFQFRAYLEDDMVWTSLSFVSSERFPCSIIIRCKSNGKNLI